MIGRLEFEPEPGPEHEVEHNDLRIECQLESSIGWPYVGLSSWL